MLKLVEEHGTLTLDLMNAALQVLILLGLAVILLVALAVFMTNAEDDEIATRERRAVTLHFIF
jgi:hypothetical protein